MDAFICDGLRTPIGRYAGKLSSIRADDLAALPLAALMARHPGLDWSALDEVVFGCANQAGEDNRNVARMAALLAGLPIEVPGTTVNRLCASGMDAVGVASRAIRAGDQNLVIAGGVESMSRAPFVMPKANASGVNDGAAALLLASEAAVRAHDLTPLVRVVAMASAGVAPRIMGVGPVPATHRVLALAGLTIDQMDVIELNEAFASQALATMRALGLPDDAPQVNPNGGAIAMGHPLGMSGARLVLTAARQLRRSGGRYALCTMCVGVGQGTAIILEAV